MKIKYFFVLLLTLLSLTSCSSKIEVTGITLSETSVQMTIGTTHQLHARVIPNDASDQTILWETSNAGVANVNNKGVVTAYGVGNASIYAYANNINSYVATCNIVVEPADVLPKEIKINSIPQYIEVGYTYNADITYSPSNTTMKELEWTSSDPSAVETFLLNGCIYGIRGLKVGQHVTITGISTKNRNVYDSVDVEVIERLDKERAVVDYFSDDDEYILGYVQSTLRAQYFLTGELKTGFLESTTSDLLACKVKIFSLDYSQTFKIGLNVKNDQYAYIYFDPNATGNVGLTYNFDEGVYFSLDVVASTPICYYGDNFFCLCNYNRSTRIAFGLYEKVCDENNVKPGENPLHFYSADSIEPTSISVYSFAETIEVGYSYLLSLTFLPDNTTKKGVYLITDSPEAIIVSENYYEPTFKAIKTKNNVMITIKSSSSQSCQSASIVFDIVECSSPEKEVVENVVEGEDYYFGYVQSFLHGNYYLTGDLTSSGFLDCTKNVNEAAIGTIVFVDETEKNFVIRLNGAYLSFDYTSRGLIKFVSDISLAVVFRLDKIAFTPCVEYYGSAYCLCNYLDSEKISFGDYNDIVDYDKGIVKIGENPLHIYNVDS